VNELFIIVIIIIFGCPSGIEREVIRALGDENITMTFRSLLFSSGSYQCADHNCEYWRSKVYKG
jgi:hypothetical protein